jgi:hypothetical protein
MRANLTIKGCLNVVIVWLLATGFCHASDSIGFQAVLNGDSGVPLATGDYTFTFTFYDAPTGGTTIATSTVPKIHIVGGVASVSIPVQARWFNGSPRFIGVSLNGNSELSPRIPLNSVPYAISASQISDTTLSADPATHGLIIQNPSYQTGEAEYFRIRQFSLDGAGPDPAMPSHQDVEILFGKLDGFDPNWTHGSYIGLKVTPNNRDVPPVEKLRVDAGGIRLFREDYQEGTVEMTAIRHVAKDGHFGASPAHEDAEIAFGKVDGFDTDWTHGSFISLKTTDNNRDNPPTEKLRVTKDGVRVTVLQITGGQDIAEPIEAASLTGLQPTAGMVVSIDPTGDRRFKLSDGPYDRKRVGIVSGGNGVDAGLVLQDSHSKRDGDEIPVALVGQVWCHADASFGKITPGDLLTTSSTPGHAMKVSDAEKARFAVIGQALTGLNEGRGWVQVLVGRQ